MSNTYCIEITDAVQIPAVVYETKKRALKESLYILLDHKEGPNVVRGQPQPLDKREGITVVRRPDGGLSWYHTNGSFCLTKGEPASSYKTYQREWGEKVIDLLSWSYDINGLAYKDADIYNGSGKQLIGTSGWVSHGARINRACWYEQDPIPAITDLLLADGIDPQNFSQALQVVKKGFFDYLAESLKAKKINMQEFLSLESILEAEKLQNIREGTIRGSCVLGKI